MTRPARLVTGGCVAFAAGLGALAVLQHRAFWTGRFDVGNLVQAVWSTAHGDVLSVTGLTGRQISRLGAHFDPIVVLFAPLWWVWPDASMLLVAQALAVATGAIPVYLLARKHLRSDWAAAGFGLAYLLHPATQWLVLDDFHPVALATPLLLWAFWFLDEGRLLPFAVVALAACLTKEEIGLVVAAMGLWYALRPGRRRAGTLIAGAGLLVTVIAFAVVIPHYSISGSSRFEGRYSAVGGSPTGILETAVTDPLALLRVVTEGRDLTYLLQLSLPLLGLFLAAPLLLIPALPELAANLLSGTITQTSIELHYTAAIVPFLVVGAIFGATRFPRLVPLLFAASIAGAVFLGPLWSGELKPDRLSQHDRVAERAVKLVPPEAPVAATNGLGAHLSARRRVFSFPVVREAEWVAVDLRDPSYLDRSSTPSTTAVPLAQLIQSGEWSHVLDDDGIVVLRRRPR